MGVIIVVAVVVMIVFHMMILFVSSSDGISFRPSSIYTAEKNYITPTMLRDRVLNPLFVTEPHPHTLLVSATPHSTPFLGHLVFLFFFNFYLFIFGCAGSSLLHRIFFNQQVGATL